MNKTVLMSFFLLSMWHGYAFGTNIIAVSRSAQGTYHVPLVFGSSKPSPPIDSLVDTGSGITVVPLSVIEVLLERNEASLTGELTGALASGEKMTVSVYTINMLQVGECKFEDVEVVVFPGRTSPILGLNIITQLEEVTFSFATDRPQLTVMNCKKKVG